MSFTLTQAHVLLGVAITLASIGVATLVYTLKRLFQGTGDRHSKQIKEHDITQTALKDVSEVIKDMSEGARAGGAKRNEQYDDVCGRLQKLGSALEATRLTQENISLELTRKKTAMDCPICAAKLTSFTAEQHYSHCLIGKFLTYKDPAGLLKDVERLAELRPDLENFMARSKQLEELKKEVNTLIARFYGDAAIRREFPRDGTEFADVEEGLAWSLLRPNIEKLNHQLLKINEQQKGAKA